MTEPTIACPHCRSEIKLTESLAAPLLEAIRRDYEQRLEQKDADVAQREISKRNARFFEAEAEKLDGWADDLKVGLEREIKELDRQIKEARRGATAALTLEEKLVLQKQIKNVEAQRNQKRRTLFDAQDQIDMQRDELIARIEGKLSHAIRSQHLFAIHWRLT